MVDTNNAATPLPPEGGGNNPNPQPNLSVVPSEGAPPVPQKTGLKKAQLIGLTVTMDLVTEARKPTHLPLLEKEGVPAAYLDALAASCEQLVLRGQRAAASDHSGEDAMLTKDPAVQALLTSLQAMQAGARLKYLPDHPALLKNYHIGERLDQSRDFLLTASQQVINHANADRPGSTDTDFINLALAQRKAVEGVKPAQIGHKNNASQERELREAEYENIIARRKKIQYAADKIWPAGQPQNVAARKAFKLPKDRPYSY